MSSQCNICGGAMMISNFAPPECMDANEAWHITIKQLSAALAAEKLKVEELELTFDLSQTAYERGTKAWQEATGKTMATPDTGDLVHFLLEKVEGLEAHTVEQDRRFLAVNEQLKLSQGRTAIQHKRAEQANADAARLVELWKGCGKLWDYGDGLKKCNDTHLCYECAGKLKKIIADSEEN